MWWSEFLRSPGFGGAAAVVAALIAYFGVRHSVKTNQWWLNARWAAERLLAGNERDATEVIHPLQDRDALVGIEMLKYLGENAPRSREGLFALTVLGAALDLDNNDTAPHNNHTDIDVQEGEPSDRGE